MNKLLLAVALVILSACTLKTESRMESLKNQLNELKPGLGEIMGVIQQHHAKLYYSANAGNWELARHQLDEVKEGLETAAKLYPRFKDVKAPLTALIPSMTKDGIEGVSKAIERRNKDDFMQGYNKLTDSCNACHEAADYGFIVIQSPSPSVLEYSNQKFEP